ncbi:hypothetical protein BJX99DRAFT_111699 [Aspergillus californicus]
MDSEYPPLPSSKVVDAALQSTSLLDGEGAVNISSGSGTPLSVAHGHQQGSSSKSCTRVIIESGDIILEYTPVKRDPTGEGESVGCRWRVSSDSLMQNSPYFRALLDPDKFYEGRHLMRQRKLYGPGIGAEVDRDAIGFPGSNPAQDMLPTIRLPDNHLSSRLGLDNIELFLKVLSFDSFNEEEKESFHAEVKTQRLPAITKLIELADAFNSLQSVRDTLRRSGYTPGKPKLPLTKFNTSMLKLNEDRIRQSISISKFLNDRTVFQMLTHTLIVTGSKSWINGIHSPEPDTPSWHYFPDGLEEELYYRRQCVLNTITDLQAHFLRVYGALGDPAGTKPPNTPGIPPPTASRQTQTQFYQCRCALGNSSACDAFHLGQMTRFFTLRTKTIFLGSTLIDPDFNPNIDEESDQEDQQSGRSSPPSQITSIIASLKQCPDYQIDSNHTACGIRRRFLPSLDCLEGFVGDERGLLGVNLKFWQGQEQGGSRAGTKWPHIAGSWANRSLQRALVIDLRLARISGIPAMSRGTFRAGSREEDARLLFTAKKRNWEA